MRDILFTGKRIDNGKWVEGYLGTFGDTTQIFVPFTNEEIKENKGHFLSAINGVWHIVDPETVGQYTGLTDKNGTKIFEGNILHFKAYRGGGFACPIGTDIYYRVLFGDCNPDMNTLTEYVGFWALGKNYDEDDLYEYGNSINYLINSHGACVIGNIHDNPELLKS